MEEWKLVDIHDKIVEFFMIFIEHAVACKHNCVVCQILDSIKFVSLHLGILCVKFFGCLIH